MKTPQQIIDEARAKADKEIAQAELVASAVARLPNEHAEYKKASVYSANADVRIGYEVETRAEALRLSRVFGPNILDLAIYRDGSCSIIPLVDAMERQRVAQQKHQNSRAAVTNQIHSVVWEFDMLVPPRSESQLMFFTKLIAPGSTVITAQVEIVITKDPARLDEEHERASYPFGRITQYRWREHGFAHGEQIKYGSGSRERPGKRVVFFWDEDGEPGGSSLADRLVSA